MAWDAGTVASVIHRNVPLLEQMGVEVLDVAAGRVRTRLRFEPGNRNHIGTVYAGVLFSFLEASGGALILVSLDVSRYIPVIVEGTVRYLRPVADTITCTLDLSEEERESVHTMLARDSKSRWMLRAAALAEDGRVACEAELIYRFRVVG